ncbi:MAG: Hsp70 family protein [Myxococcales bacterium]|nr:Hsp70 family protein [Myxococcales bacterium]
MADAEPVIGIDLGTTNSCVAVVLGGEVHVIPDEQGRRLQASVVAFLADGSVVVGNSARREIIADPANTIYSAKRLIGRHFQSKEVKTAIQQFPYKVVKGKNQVPLIEIRGERYGLPEISGMVLRRMKDIAERYLGQPVRKAVITVPANFNDTQRQMTKTAGNLAGLDVLRVINEPTAAALAYGYGRDIDARLAIYDFGGGTFDLTLLDIKGNVFEVVSTAGDTFLGGDDFDNRLTRYMLLAFRRQNGFSIDEDPLANNRLKQVAEKLKRELGQRERAIVNVHELALDGERNPVGLKFQLDRAGFNERCQDIVQRTFLVCDEALREANLRSEDIDGVVLVGGSTRMPLVREMVAGYFGREPLVDINPDEVVAIGAAIQGAALEADPFAAGARAQPLLLDVTPMSLGVQTAGGYVDVLIGRNAPIPCEQSRNFTTTADGQTSVRLQIYQGESRVAAENTKLGEVELVGLTPAARGQVEIQVTFEIDTDGIVVVTARDRQTGIEQEARIEVSAGYAPDEMQAMIDRSR